MLAILTSSIAWGGWNVLKPIGYIDSCYASKFGTPRQGAVVPDAAASLCLSELENIDAKQALEGLEQYSHVWLLWAAHLNGHEATQSKVRAPKLRGGKAGLFSTRSPFRPNPIGLSLVRLEGVHGDRLALSGVDLVDGTPIIDVKPYLPQYDMPRPGSGEVRTATWVDPEPIETITFAPEAEEALEALRSGAINRGAAASSSLTADAAQFRRALVQTLAADPRPLYRWRREQQGGGKAATGSSGEYDITFDGLICRCRFGRKGDSGKESVLVLSLTSDHAEDSSTNGSKKT